MKKTTRTTETALPPEISWKKNVGLFLGSQAISMIGSMLVQYAIAWHIALETESGSMMAIAIIAGILPTFFISPFGGVLADRFNRKYLIIIADAAIAFATLILALIFWVGYKQIWLLFVVSAIRAVGMGIQNPAVNAMIPQITPAEHLTRVNGINSSIQSAAMLIAPMLSGALLSFSGIEALFFVDVITAAIGISIVFFFVKTQAPKKTAQASEMTNYFHDLKEGMIYIWRHKYVKRFCLLSACFLFAVAPMAFLTGVQVARNFGPDVWRLTVVEIAFSSGMLLGGLLMSTWGGFKNRIISMMVSCAVCGIGSILLGLATNFWFYSAVMALTGLVMPLFNVPSTTILQSSVEEAFMGRVFGVFSMISSATMPLGMALFGPLGDIISIDTLLVITGIFIFLLSFAFITSRTLRKAGTMSSEQWQQSAGAAP